ncbi:MAG TPA: FAD-dependent oxidoreductase [Spirochaetia bacterium]|nr:FAD-dependent oxidoreductase [Spirochaetia bacterium]
MDMGSTAGTENGARLDVVVIGGGATGCGMAWDLSLRGLSVALVERGELASGTTGRFHGLLHSGARYAVTDPSTAGECARESSILRRLAPSAIDDSGGLFVFGGHDDPGYLEAWMDGCRRAGIPFTELAVPEALGREPGLEPGIRRAFEVRDAVCNSVALCGALGRGAASLGARLLTHRRCDEIITRAGRVTGVRLTDTTSGEASELACRLVVIAAGPWSGRIAESAGVRLSLDLVRGTMVAFRGPWVKAAVNRLSAPGDGDIILRRGRVSIAGTTSVVTADPDDRTVDDWEVERVQEQIAALVPGLAREQMVHAWAGVRPLYDARPRDAAADGNPHSWSRDFTVLDHGARDGVDGLVSIVGGKLTSFRLMAEKTSDVVCEKLGAPAVCRTAEIGIS